MVRFPAYSCVLAVLVAVAVSYAGMSREQRLVEFLAGCEVLSDAVTMRPADKADGMRWLVKHTGMTANKAVAVIESYRNRPADWRKVLDAVRAKLEPQPAEQAQPATTAKP